MKTEMWVQALSVFGRRNHFTTVVGMDLVFNDLLSPSSTTRALKHLYVVPVAGDPSAAISLEIWLEASAPAPNYGQGWDSPVSPQLVQSAPQRTGSAMHSQARFKWETGQQLLLPNSGRTVDLSYLVL